MEEASVLQILPVYPQLMRRVGDMEKQIESEFGLKIFLQIRALEHEYEMDIITRIVSDTLKVPINRILSGERISIEAVTARHIAIWLIEKYLPGISVKNISEFFSRDVSTVNKSIEKVNDLLSVGDKKMTESLTQCEAALNEKINGNANENLH